MDPMVCHQSASGSGQNFDYLLKFLLVGDSDVGKNEIIGALAADGGPERAETEPYSSSNGVACKTTVILLEGKRVKLQLWDTSGQGRFSTIIRSYSRGAQGVLVVYDITNRWSFDGIDRWLQEVEEQAPGVPKILIGNRLHLEFNRAVSRDIAEVYAHRHGMDYFEVSPLAHFNILESLAQLARLVLRRSRMGWMLKPTKVLSLQDLCCHCIARHLRTVYDADHLPLPPSLRRQLRSFASNTLLSSSNALRRTDSGPGGGPNLSHRGHGKSASTSGGGPGLSFGHNPSRPKRRTGSDSGHGRPPSTDNTPNPSNPPEPPVPPRRPNKDRRALRALTLTNGDPRLNPATAGRAEDRKSCRIM